MCQPCKGAHHIPAVRFERFQLLFSFSHSDVRTFAMVSLVNVSLADNSVWDMALDSYRHRALLYTHGNSLITTDGTSNEIVAGQPDESGYKEGKGRDARFHFLISFVHVSPTQIVAADYRNRCLRLINRVTGLTSVLAGQCKVMGYNDGPSALFNAPKHVIQDKMNTDRILVSDRHNWAVRSVSLSTKTTKTLVQSGIMYDMRDLTQDSSSGDIIVFVVNTVYKIDYYSHVLTKLAGAKTNVGFKDGSFDTAQFDTLHDGVEVGKSTFIVPDIRNNKLRILDTNLNVTSSLSINTISEQSGRVTKFDLIRPGRVIVSAGTLFIAMGGEILAGIL